MDATQDKFDELTGVEVEQRTGESAIEYTKLICKGIHCLSIIVQFC